MKNEFKINRSDDRVVVDIGFLLVSKGTGEPYMVTKAKDELYYGARIPTYNVTSLIDGSQMNQSIRYSQLVGLVERAFDVLSEGESITLTVGESSDE